MSTNAIRSEVIDRVLENIRDSIESRRSRSAPPALHRENPPTFKGAYWAKLLSGAVIKNIVMQAGKPTIVCVLGAQWGDEGKGKIVDKFMSDGFDVVARCQGGNNAGHTVVADGKTYDFHCLPSGILHDKSTSLIGNGVVVHLPSLFKELEKNNIEPDKKLHHRLVISDRAHLVFDFHQQVDGINEDAQRKEGHGIGTTKKGIGPAYSKKYFRTGIRIADLLGDESEFQRKFLALYESFKREFPDLEVNMDEQLKRYQYYAFLLKDLKLVRDGVRFMHGILSNVEKPQSLLVEGANGTLLDIDFGTYPYVTSSSCSVGGIFTGLGIPPSYKITTVGVVKAYQTRVGDGPFPTEQKNEVGEKLRSVGHEFGVTTGRPRRCGWLDLVLLKYAHMINGFTAFALTKLDILDSFEKIQVAVGYKLRGEVIDYVPAYHKDLDAVEVVYKEFEGWKMDTTNIKTYEELPERTKEYIRFIEEAIGVPIWYIGTGKDRDALIIRRS